jgi:hypothetical protein
MISTKGSFIINFNKEDKLFVDKLKLEKKLKEMKEFYLLKEIPKIKICFVYSPEEYEFHTGNKFEKWIMASVYYGFKIFIFSPKVIERFTSHTKEEVESTIFHEISHLLYGFSKFQNLPLFNEGLASYFKEGLCNHKINFRIESLKGFKEYKHNYPVGRLIISSIIRRFGKESNIKIIDFIKSVKMEDNDTDLNKKFEEIFGVSVNALIQLQGGVKYG